MLLFFSNSMIVCRKPPHRPTFRAASHLFFRHQFTVSVCQLLVIAEVSKVIPVDADGKVARGPPLGLP